MWESEERESRLLFAPHFLLAFCFILWRMTSAAHPRSVSFHLPSALLLHFKLMLVPSCVRFPSWWNYLFRSMCPHAHHITLNHAQTYYTYDWLIWMCFFRMLQNNQLERLPDDAPWDLPNLLSLWVFITHMHTVIMLLDHRQQAISNSLATHSHISGP